MKLLEDLRGQTAPPDSELGREMSKLLKHSEACLAVFLKNRRKNRRRNRLIGLVVVVLLAALVGWAIHWSEQEAEAAAQAKIVAEREAAEAIAKAEQEAAAAALAKIVAEREAAEAKAKLPSELQANLAGSVAKVPLEGKALMAFAYCPAGSFTMGSPSSEYGHSSDENQVRVTLSKGFWLAKTEVTQAQWRAVMRSNPSGFKGDRLPVESVSWDDAREFIRKVNASGVLPAGWKMALPTEAQWEYACRAGASGPYSGGTVGEVAWYGENSGRTTHAVGTKKANAWGLNDMHGNVWEWCADWFGAELPGGTDPTGASSGGRRVFRGGSWYLYDAGCRAADRGRFDTDDRYGNLGFRPALVPSE